MSSYGSLIALSYCIVINQDFHTKKGQIKTMSNGTVELTCQFLFLEKITMQKRRRDENVTGCCAFLASIAFITPVVLDKLWRNDSYKILNLVLCYQPETEWQNNYSDIIESIQLDVM
jgi:uncharacterized membrane protein YhaH (DUF805 family)